LIEGCYVKHNQQHLSNVATHTAIVKEGTKLYEILGEKEIHVNSFHHLAANEIADGYIVSAVSKDGVIEAIEKEGDEFVIGVQWHPEMMTKDNPMMQKIFQALVDETTK
ncbi:MAG: gamma-glutamyl-gamma-aminobutyrate hydrolase family protein, partial [Paeniclostridium sordellii]|nr:gamma-glutamyl-gamma-aminobutyrate hydrolase family protein [Paeniclostridium sordellii]